jgi:hypothetical protein
LDGSFADLERMLNTIEIVLLSNFFRLPIR